MKADIGSILSLLLYLFYIGLAFYFIYDLVFKRHNPIKSLSWIVVMLLLPYVGLILYIYFGRNFRKTKMYSRKGLHDEKLKRELSAQQIEQFNRPDIELPNDLAEHRKLILLALNNSKSLLTEHNNVHLYFTGKEALEAMYECAAKASHHIHLQSFILENDAVGTIWKNLLIQKAKEGVEVRLIYDDFGSWHLPKKYVKALQNAGAQVESFGKVGYPSFRAMINYRNHRKLLIVDGKWGFLGGVNLADRYYDGGASLQWRDAHIRIDGEAVTQIQSSFLMDWFFITHKNLRLRKRYNYKLPELNTEPAPETCFMQIVSSGPDSDWADMMQLYLTLITQAKKRISLTSPYFIPNESILNALRTAALGGVEVRILLPERGDSNFVHFASLSYVNELLDAGIKVFLYTKGFIHAKVISIDGTCCLIGSANMDNRSLEHHFEVGAIIYNKEVSSHVEAQFDRDLLNSRLIIRRIWDRRPVHNKIYEGLTRLLSPLL